MISGGAKAIQERVSQRVSVTGTPLQLGPADSLVKVLVTVAKVRTVTRRAPVN